MPPVRRWLFPPDLGARAKWQASSAFPDTPMSGEGTRSEKPFFVHTQFQDGPWVSIDLGRTVRISKIVVENRADCCQERALPLDIEIPEGTGWRQVCQRRSPFDSWSCHPRDTKTRTLRLRRPGVGALHLKRVAIFP